MAADRSDNVVRFPPLPPVPAPPSFPPDARQRAAARIIGNLTGLMESAGGVAAGANLTSGFPAASVDLARLQAALEKGLSAFSMEQLTARWDEDVRGWVHATLHAWIQRCKQHTVRLAANGVAIELQTQDDLGYYEYRFDVFPGR